jgi:uncharacterized SAM-binding protein YcdF (DUF218 family)
MARGRGCRVLDPELSRGRRTAGANGHRDYRPLETADAASGAQAVVLLSGGSRTIRAAGGRLPVVTTPSAMRALETARVYRLLGDPLVIVSGGITESDGKSISEADAIRAAVVALGVPAGRIVLESESRNTREEAVALKRMLAERRIDRFVIVTSAIHMGRSMGTFAVEGLHPVASAAPIYQDRSDAPFALMPNEMSLEIGNAVVYEWGARAYYWWRGWI